MPAPLPGTTALDAASKAYGFTYTNDFDVINTDFYIDKISTSITRTATRVGWTILINSVIPANPASYTTEGCKTECSKAGDDVLWLGMDR